MKKTLKKKEASDRRPLWTCLHGGPNPLKIRNIRPGMSHVSVKVRVTRTAAVQRITTGGGLQRDVQQLKVDDESGSITLVLWDDKIEPLKP
ncbi:MAG: hypothetical protein JSV87_04250, partial [Candidatus Bathyarchaeota archaeon]